MEGEYSNAQEGLKVHKSQTLDLALIQELKIFSKPEGNEVGKEKGGPKKDRQKERRKGASFLFPGASAA